MTVNLAGASNKNRMERLTRHLQSFENNRTYTRDFRRDVQHVGSFIGRGFKQLLQILPVVLSAEYTDPVVDRDITLLNESLKMLEKLCSLVFQIALVHLLYCVYMVNTCGFKNFFFSQAHNFIDTKRSGMV